MMHLILYTTLYREGGSKFERVARTLEQNLRDAGKTPVLSRAVESKRDVKAVLHELKAEGKSISELHFIGHSGMYGPMFGTTDYPEQFSPWEWEQLEVPFAENAEAYFSCCRSARWFAPFFARTFEVPTHGYHWYTSFSQSAEKFKADLGDDPEKPLYAIGWPGKKSHGWRGAFKKYIGKTPPEAYKRYDPSQINGDATYNQVAQLYDNVFQDIKVREDEWKWLNEHLPKTDGFTMLDIGCGNGALLKELAPRLSSGAGADLSVNILERAREMNKTNPHLEFKQLDGPKLPFDDNSFNVVTSLLSYRYLDWDPIMAEIERVLKPNGKMLIVDMVTAPVRVSEYPKLLSNKISTYQQRKKRPEFHANLHKLVAHPDWKKMLEYNPIRSEHEMKWYLESRFPDRKAEIINVGWNARILAFDTGPFSHIKKLELTYP